MQKANSLVINVLLFCPIFQCSHIWTELNSKIPACCQTPEWNQQLWPHLNLQKEWKITTPGGSFWPVSSGDLSGLCCGTRGLNLLYLLCCLLWSESASNKYLWSPCISWEWARRAIKLCLDLLWKLKWTSSSRKKETKRDDSQDGYNCYQGMSYLFQRQAVKILENVCQVL